MPAPKTGGLFRGACLAVLELRRGITSVKRLRYLDLDILIGKPRE